MSKQQLTIVNLNLWHGGRLYEPMLEFLRQTDADILIAQEAYDGTDEQLSVQFRTMTTLPEALGYDHAAFERLFPLTVDGARTHFGNAVFSRFPITSSRATFFDVPYTEDYEHPQEEPGSDFSQTPRALQVCELDIDGIALNVFNNHGIWGFDGKDTERRLAMTDTILQTVGDQQRTLLAGDFNVDEKTRTIGNIEKRLTNIFKGERTTSFNVSRKDSPGYATAVVDFIFVSDDIEVITHESPEVDVSDHLPLVCRLAFQT